MPERTYRAILFDLDGTLIDNTASFHLAFERYCARYPDVLDRGNVTEREELMQIYREKDRPAAYRRFCSWWEWKNAPDFQTFWQEWFSLYVHSAVPFPWTTEVLTRLRQHFLLGLITNGAGVHQHAKISSAGLAEYFSVIIVSEDVGIAKPEPAVYRLCADRLGVAPGDCLFVGDTPGSDIAGAAATGMDSLLVSGKEDERATYTAENITYLKTLLDLEGKGI